MSTTCVLETTDGQPHLDQVLPVLKAGKPVFVDKPNRGQSGRCHCPSTQLQALRAPVFSSSSLRFKSRLRRGPNRKFREVLGADAYSPCSLEKTPSRPLLVRHPPGVETLFTAIGAGCETVSRTSTKDFDVAVGMWTSGRVGTFPRNS